ncbi:sigma-70 family RNA polymerase sigma factor [Methylobrevis pamukkalensis]|uniref:ECF RNA polymerase sigma factor SigR n=1 Tax=Methylobrevis pamukkalensis TaxID=1439726 RepID=A0A1E3H7G3_9HYPH|nr:sigma-70 family RNA polymerase sigma factor [Methylobrevis pamukkalensis]ODN72095.1 ECF RNA polymerase sigma factor SigR [Methylobrevis pamukkalensis]
MATPSTSFRDGIVAEIPSLRAFAMSLCGKPDLADDLVQEALMKAWAASASFSEGTNLRAWMFTILRNVYFSQLRKKKREVEDADGRHAARLSVSGEQQARLDMSDFQEALGQLPADQREVLTLIGASGFSYEEAAEICGVPVGTIKSRLNRARGRLTAILAIEHVSDIGPDAATMAATASF